MVLRQPARSTPVPALASGDRLTRAEFERRYEATSEEFKAELIEGVGYVASPVRAFHGVPHAALVGWLAVYWAATPNVSAADNTTTRLDLDNEPQPDALLRIETGGTSTISEDGYIEGTPELIALNQELSAFFEICSSNSFCRFWDRQAAIDFSTLLLIAYQDSFAIEYSFRCEELGCACGKFLIGRSWR